MTNKPENKICKDCQKEKHVDEFIKADGKHRGTRNRCKQCTSHHSKIRSKLRKKFPPPQQNLCKICKVETEKLVLDHCHKTNTFRGYICKDCNSGIGLLKDRVSILFRSLIYLIVHKIKTRKHGMTND